MQGAGDGRELSITFQTSGKAVRLGAPEKWRKAVAGEDIKPDSWVEIHRQGGSPQTVRAGDVPELHALFVELGLAPNTPPTPVADEADPTVDVAADGADATSTMAPIPPLVAGAEGFGGPGLPPPPAVHASPGREGRRIGGGIAAFVIGLVVLTNILRSCSHDRHRADLSPPSSQMTIAVDSAPPPAAPSPPAATPAAPAQLDPAQAAPVAQTPIAEAAAGPSFDCGRVTSDILKLVCATPDLAAADRSLAAAYQAALAATNDPAALRDSERAWIVARNAASADVDQLRALYAERIQVLRNAAAAAKSPEPF